MNTYEKHLQDRGLSQYTFDGAINHEKWTASKVKVLFYLKENWGYQDCENRKIGDLAHGWLDGKNRTYRKSVLLAATIEIALQRNGPLSPDEINSVKENGELLHATLDRMAVVSIKKHSGNSTSNDREIRDESRMNASILKDQISKLAPTIIVAGGKVCWHSLTSDIGLFDAAQKCPKFEAVICSNTVLFYSNHPSARRVGEFDIETIHHAIFSAIQRPNSAEQQLSA